MSGGASSSLVLAWPRITAGRVVFYVIGRVEEADLAGVCSDRVLLVSQTEWGRPGLLPSADRRDPKAGKARELPGQNNIPMLRGRGWDERVRAGSPTPCARDFVDQL